MLLNSKTERDASEVKVTPAASNRRANATTWTGLLIFCLTFAVFRISPVHQVTDSKYSMILSQSLVDHHSFILDRYALSFQPVRHGDYFMSGESYQLEVVAGHLFYYFPPGSPILSVPYVAFMNLFGISAVRPDGTHNEASEIKIQAGLARLLMAAFAVIAFNTARLLLPLGWSAVIALGGAFGTPVYSTASRGLWSDTWGILLLEIALFLLLAQEVGRRRLSPILFATLSAWMYVVRPTYSVHITALSCYLLIFHRQIFLRYALTGGIWLAGFVYYSWSQFGTLLPSYYRSTRLTFEVFWTALAGNLISPSRGVLLYVPVLLFIAYLLLRYRRHVALPRLALLALVVIIGHLVVVSSFLHWWGGMSFGPRFMTGLVPWFILLAILGVHAMLDWRKGQAVSLSLRSWHAPLASGATLLLLSCVINARGACSLETFKWNPDKNPSELWNWSEPQFLIGLLPPPLPRQFPLAPSNTRINVLSEDAEQFMGYGWSEPESAFRWSDGHKAVIVFALNEIRDTTLRMNLEPFLVPGRLTAQRVLVDLNGQAVGELTLTEQAASIQSFALRKSALRGQNTLTLQFPNAASPRSFKLSRDPRLLGIHVDWIEFQPQSTP
jgi:hypothetical protein